MAVNLILATTHEESILLVANEEAIVAPGLILPITEEETCEAPILPALDDEVIVAPILPAPNEEPITKAPQEVKMMVNEDVTITAKTMTNLGSTLMISIKKSPQTYTMAKRCKEQIVEYDEWLDTINNDKLFKNWSEGVRSMNYD